MGLGEVILLLAIVPLEMPVTDTVDFIEVNSFYDDSGKHVFDQAIFRDWNPHTRKFEIRDWRLLKSQEQYPSGSEMIWLDSGKLRKVRGTVFRTWTQFDTEVFERQELPKEQRRPLTDLRKTIE